MQLNVEGFSKSKAEVLERIAMKGKIDVLVVQETHIADQEELLKRRLITGFTILPVLLFTANMAPLPT